MSKQGHGGRLIRTKGRPVDRVVHRKAGRRKGEKRRVLLAQVKKK